MTKLHYFKAPVVVFDEEKANISVPDVLVSRQGIYRVFEESQQVQQDFLSARIFTVKVDNQYLQARLVREQGSEGVHYNMRILSMTETQQGEFYKLLNLRGIPSPWSREYPRIPTANTSQFVEKPARIIFPRVAGQANGIVINFSYLGLMFEFSSTGISLSEYVGKSTLFHILTNHGVVLGEVEARITRIYDEMKSPGRLTRGIGVKFTNFHKSSREIYDNMILDICHEIKKGN